MSAWSLLQVVVNLVLMLGLVVLWMRMRRPPKDDPRLSRGLQLLQSKIVVLEDLSDRTDRQVKQLSSLLEQKTKLLQNKIFDADKQMHKIEQSMEKSREVAEIFQDKIPHQEIIERQQTIKYVRAARLAHAGRSVDEIAIEVDLPREQLEFIAKVNKDQLMFDNDQLPEWAHEDEIDEISEVAQEETQAYVNDEVFESPELEFRSLQRLGEEFRSACAQYNEEHGFNEKGEDLEAVEKDMPQNKEVSSEPSQLMVAAKNLTSKIIHSASDFLQEPEKAMAPKATMTSSVATTPNTPMTPNAAPAPAVTPKAVMFPTKTQVISGKEAHEKDIRPVRFPKIDINNNLS